MFTPTTTLFRLARIAFLLGALVCLFCAPTHAQTFRGTILGTVTDPNGALVPGAKVTAKNVGTGIERETVTDGDGNYTIAELPVGTYEVSAEQSGFARAVVSNVLVEVAGERRVDIPLNVSGANIDVVVAASAQVETTSNTLGGTITEKEAAELPV